VRVQTRAQIALLLSCLLAVGSIAVGLYVAVNRDCRAAGVCDDDAVAFVVGIPLVLLGIGMLAGAAFGWARAPGLTAQVSCIVWACVLLLAGGAIGGAANVLGIALAALAVVMGTLSVWVPR
jgi:hypothetical protein